MNDAVDRAESLFLRLRDQGVSFMVPGGEFNVFGLSLARGLVDLGIPCFGQASDWPVDRGGDCPLIDAPIRLATSGLVVVDIRAIQGRANRTEPIALDRLRKLGPERLVFLLDTDDSTNRITPKDIPTLVSHENRLFEVEGWRLPWCFGLMPSTLPKIERINPGPRTDVINRAFTPSFHQGLRDHLDAILLPRLAERRPIDRSLDPGTDRVRTAYMRRLSEADICLAYGGQFMPDITSNPFLMRSQAALMNHAQFHGGPVLFRWDSWRFWESLACGAATVHVDLEKYGCHLPVMPTNWVHYVGLDLGNLERDIDRLLSPETDRRAIGEAGRTWVRQHYSPVAQAFRLISSLALAGRG
ncbi:MAG: glycosyltransferase [Rhodospirillum sp.]|nr:glycosyltransferase [Rhodospirillum sp.]MCF8490002.1 glycosyltransferase [Rhodospirillum sp.]MCF8498837.1 glycosyltransferase [Rhodospirillum sp.]